MTKKVDAVNQATYASEEVLNKTFKSQYPELTDAQYDDYVHRVAIGNTSHDLWYWLGGGKNDETFFFPLPATMKQMFGITDVTKMVLEAANFRDEIEASVASRKRSSRRR